MGYGYAIVLIIASDKCASLQIFFAPEARYAASARFGAKGCFMRNVIFAVAVLVIASPVMAGGRPGRASAGGHAVSGYVKSNGTLVAPHMQTNPNATKYDNYSTKGNVNPYTAKAGTVDPTAVRPAYTPY